MSAATLHPPAVEDPAAHKCAGSGASASREYDRIACKLAAGEHASDEEQRSAVRLAGRSMAELESLVATLRERIEASRTLEQIDRTAATVPILRADVEDIEAKIEAANKAHKEQMQPEHARLMTAHQALADARQLSGAGLRAESMMVLNRTWSRKSREKFQSLSDAHVRLAGRFQELQLLTRGSDDRLAAVEQRIAIANAEIERTVVSAATEGYLAKRRDGLSTAIAERDRLHRLVGELVNTEAERDNALKALEEFQAVHFFDWQDTDAD